MSLLDSVDDFAWSSVFFGLARGKVPVDGDEAGDDDAAVGSLRLYRNLIIFSHYNVSEEAKVFIRKLILCRITGGYIERHMEGSAGVRSYL